MKIYLKNLFIIKSKEIIYYRSLEPYLIQKYINNIEMNKVVQTITLFKKAKKKRKKNCQLIEISLLKMLVGTSLISDVLTCLIFRSNLFHTFHK